MTEAKSSGRHFDRPDGNRLNAETPDLSASAVKVTMGGDRRVYTRRLRTLHAAVVLFASLILALGLPSEFVIGNDVLAATSSGVILVAGLLLCTAVLRRAIVVTPGLVTIRGLLTTRRLPVGEVARFEPPSPYGKVFGRVALRIVLADGGIRYSGVFTNTPTDGGGTGVDECNELNRCLAIQTGSSGDQAGRLSDRRPEPKWVMVLWVGWLLLLALFALFCLILVVGSIPDPAFGG